MIGKGQVHKTIRKKASFLQENPEEKKLIFPSYWEIRKKIKNKKDTNIKKVPGAYYLLLLFII
jgi:hypothetical protein